MKEVTHFVCETCGTEFSEREKCEACETGHARKLKICHADYRPIGVLATGFPSMIRVEGAVGDRKFLAEYRLAGMTKR